jgi:hypothetical protein
METCWSLTVALMEIELPISCSPATDIACVEPQLAIPVTVNVDPQRTKDLTEIEDPLNMLPIKDA